ncbi:hypothetical protein B7755_017060 [Streptomyces sp. NBS 14/10]|nr:hypothetical protein [Streptomyces sp. NBS 14/10]KAK1179704.1 hypothetical protein B7755_017060 [Streptomyces sp. NBS 14/10]
MPGTNGDDDRREDREPRGLGRVGQFLALVTALVIDLVIRRLIGG